MHCPFKSLKTFDQNFRILNYMAAAYLAWGLAHVSHREEPFVKIKSRKTKNQAFGEFKYLDKTNCMVPILTGELSPAICTWIM